jgi:hypothetical protein
MLVWKRSSRWNQGRRSSPIMSSPKAITITPPTMFAS